VVVVVVVVVAAAMAMLLLMLMLDHMSPSLCVTAFIGHAGTCTRAPHHDVPYACSWYFITTSSNRQMIDKLL
jgi:hypothetical protein